ncbi:unnamed protein product [Acanthoscelides obtectus]|uniref:Peptidase S1 domain-containing protein n=1 Tax=Acanthoscelides obtectus TaxID=200917 RepID=A0A9P0KVP9_ACAOB|nr:unnamed protein product [Acanthoscelides obtectus]CAK1643993.1 hypothetical protein AOBTE_LOCUS13769 [Acanthoscelides obtectus]
MCLVILSSLLYLLCIIAIGSASSSKEPEEAVSSIEHHDNWRHLDRKNCGRTRYDDIRGRIIDGDEAKIGQFPWLVRIGVRISKIRLFTCAGSLLNRYYVLSAAHCGDRNNIVTLGEHNVLTPQDCEAGICADPLQEINIKRYHFFDYNPKDHKRDFSLILLENAVVYNDFVVPVCLPHGKVLTEDLTGKNVKVAGWGYTNSTTHDQAVKLMYIVAPIIDKSVCNSIFHHGMDETQLCIGYEHGKKDSCSGDSGGPVTKFMKASTTKRQHYQIGIVSYGLVDCGGGPAIYTNVIHYMPKILDIITKS